MFNMFSLTDLDRFQMEDYQEATESYLLFEQVDVVIHQSNGICQW